MRTSLLAALVTAFTGIASTALGSAYNTSVLSNSPVSYHQLDETSGTNAADATANGHTGTYLGTPTLGATAATPLLGTTPIFDGTDNRVQIPDAAAFNVGTGDFTVEFWFKSGSTGRGDIFNYKDNDGSPTGDFGIFWSDGGTQKLSLYHNTGVLATSYGLSPNTWYHAAYVRSGTTGRFYVDGVPHGTALANSQTMNIDHDLLIGMNHDASENPESPFNGQIDEVAFYNTALSQAQLKSHFTASAFTASSAATTRSVGVNFSGGINTTDNPGGWLTPTDSAGVVPQVNWNNVDGTSGSGIAVNDDTGAASGITFNFTAGGLYTAGSAGAASADEILNRGFVYGTSTVNVATVPYGKYDVIVYTLNDASGRQQTTTLTSADGTFNFYGESPNPSNSGLVDGNLATPYAYSKALSTTAGVFTSGANYVRFTNLTASSFTLTTSAPGNGYLSGFQIVQVPEPSSLALVGTSLIGLLTIRRRKRS